MPRKCKKYSPVLFRTKTVISLKEMETSLLQSSIMLTRIWQITEAKQSLELNSTQYTFSNLVLSDSSMTNYLIFQRVMLDFDSNFGDNWDLLENVALPGILPEIEKFQLTSIYNSVPNHARPTALNALSNTLLTFLDTRNVSDVGIYTTTWPLPIEKVVSVAQYKEY